MNEDELTVRKRSAAIKLAKELKPYDMDLGMDFLPIYIETMTEDMKQIGRDNRRLAKELDLIAKNITGNLFTIPLDGESEVITKLMRRYSTRINKSCTLLYEIAYLDFDAHEEAKVEAHLEEDEDDDTDE
jgi:Txe/YoeB family toxin of Txe-Axe toxin-antitoxin module